MSQVFLSLTNLAVLPDWHHHFLPLLPTLLETVSLRTEHSRAKEAVTFQCLRLLVNLSCNDNNAPHLLAAQCPHSVASLLSRGQPEDRLLRCLTLLANVYMAAIRQDLHTQQFQDNSLHQAMFGAENIHILKEVEWITRNTNNMDIKSQARKILTCLEGIPRD